MIRVFAGILLLAFLASTAWAGPSGKGQGQGMQGQRMAHIQQALGLSQEQVEQIREIRQKGGGREDIRAVLTDEQRALMDEHRAARQAQDGRPPRGEMDGQGRRNRGVQPSPPGDGGDGNG